MYGQVQKPFFHDYQQQQNLIKLEYALISIKHSINVIGNDKVDQQKVILKFKKDYNVVNILKGNLEKLMIW